MKYDMESTPTPLVIAIAHNADKTNWECNGMNGTLKYKCKVSHGLCVTVVRWLPKSLKKLRPSLLTDLSGSTA